VSRVRVVGIERALIPGCAEMHAGLIPLVIAVALPRVSVAAEVMHVIVVLKEAVLFNDLGHFRTHIGTEDGCRKFRMVVRSQLIADIVDKRRDDRPLVGADGRRPPTAGRLRFRSKSERSCSCCCVRRSMLEGSLRRTRSQSGRIACRPPSARTKRVRRDL